MHQETDGTTKEPVKIGVALLDLTREFQNMQHTKHVKQLSKLREKLSIASVPYSYAYHHYRIKKLPQLQPGKLSVHEIPHHLETRAHRQSYLPRISSFPYWKTKDGLNQGLL
jgi:hypothetical protein